MSAQERSSGTFKGALYGFLQGDINHRTYSDLHFQHTVCPRLAAGKEAVFL